MKKFFATLLCITMMASMIVVANAATELPEGGQLRNTGDRQAYGYTDGGTSGKAYMNCTIEIANTSSGKVVGWTVSNISMGNKAHLNVVAWQGSNELANNQLQSPSTTGTSFSLPVYGGSATTVGTAGHSYSSSQYGDWICGTEITR